MQQLSERQRQVRGRLRAPDRPRLIAAWELARVGLLACALCCAPRAFAQEAPPAASAQPEVEPAGYGEAIAAALAEHDRHNYEEARVHFQRAHALYPNARTLRGLGMVEFELRNYGAAMHYLEQALSSRVKPLDEALQRETEKLLARARLYVGEVHIDVDPGYATVSVDGVTVASGPKASFSLVVGDHLLEFRAHGRLPERRAISVHGGEQTVIQVVLPAPALTSAAARPAALPPAALHDDRTPLRRQWWLWTVVGVVAAGAAVGIAVAATHDEKRAAVSGGSTDTVLVNP
jgi:hypothetical protein